jgi:predicted TIM-barrel fold metal-dependent hydrolase
MRLVHDLVGADRLLFASDHPWVDPQLILGHLEGLHLPAEAERKIVSDNARALFKLPAAPGE